MHAKKIARTFDSSYKKFLSELNKLNWKNESKNLQRIVPRAKVSMQIKFNKLFKKLLHTLFHSYFQRFCYQFKQFYRTGIEVNVWQSFPIRNENAQNFHCTFSVAFSPEKSFCHKIIRFPVPVGCKLLWNNLHRWNSTIWDCAHISRKVLCGKLEWSEFNQLCLRSGL